MIFFLFQPVCGCNYRSSGKLREADTGSRLPILVQQQKQQYSQTSVAETDLINLCFVASSGTSAITDNLSSFRIPYPFELVPHIRLSTVGRGAFKLHSCWSPCLEHAAGRDNISTITDEFCQRFKTWLFRQLYPELIHHLSNRILNV